MCLDQRALPYQSSILFHWMAHVANPLTLLDPTRYRVERFER